MTCDTTDCLHSDLRELFSDDLELNLSVVCFDLLWFVMLLYFELVWFELLCFWVVMIWVVMIWVVMIWVVMILSCYDFELLWFELLWFWVCYDLRCYLFQSDLLEHGSSPDWEGRLLVLLRPVEEQAGRTRGKYRLG